jgi:quercetin dioxygenase-like cupin family protein
MTKLIAALAVALSFAAAADEAKKPAAAKPMKKEAISLNAADLKWGDAPPNFPKGAQLVVLYGNPGAKGAFALRFKMPDGYKIAPHWHSQDEQLTILSGTFILHMGDSMDAPAHTLDAGAFHFLPAKMHHAAEAKGETSLELHGNGPFDIHYLNPADDPTPKAEAAK